MVGYWPNIDLGSFRDRSTDGDSRKIDFGSIVIDRELIETFRTSSIERQKSYMNRIGSFIGLFLSVSLVGCGSSDGLVTISGNVTFEGVPVENGRIQFRSLTGDMRAYSTEIEDGKYELALEPGQSRVEIYASRLIPGKTVEVNPGEFDPVGEMYIPEKYNSRSELTVSLEAVGGTHDFDL